MKKLLIAISLLLGILQSCRESKDVYVDIRPEYLEWINFKEGSWWVYQDSATSIQDSIYVKSTEEGYFQLKDWHYFEYKRINIQSHTSSLNQYYNTSALSDGIYLTLSRSDISQTKLVRFPIIAGEASKVDENPDRVVVIDSVYTTFHIHSDTFSSVVRSYDNSNALYNYSPTKTYMCKGLGIIRTEIPELDQVWNLVRYKIVK